MVAVKRTGSSTTVAHPAVHDIGDSARASARASDGLLACLAALTALAVQATQGFPTLFDGGANNDNMMRMVQVRDLLAGQGWFDLHQYRMGLKGGFVMHWSRLVDAPIAALVLTFRMLGAGTATAEAAAALVWPTLLFAAAMFFIIRCVRGIGDEWAVLPAVVLGTSTLYFTGLFTPAALDHHNVQIVLLLAMTRFLLAPSGTMRTGAAAGAAAALMLAVGIETLPYVACGGAFVALAFLLQGERESRRAIGFGLAFAGAALLALLLAVPPDVRFLAQCDTFSGAQFATALLGGAGLALVASVPVLRGSPVARVSGLAVVGAGLAVLALTAFPQCLASPYAGLDPRLQRYWLDSIIEAQSALAVLRHTPENFAGYYVTPLLGMTVLLVARWGTPGRARALLLTLLGMAVLVSLWQLRGAMFALALAVVPLATWVAVWRRRAAANATGTAQLCMAGAWLVSTTLVWQLASVGVEEAFAAGSRDGVEATAGPADAASQDGCYEGDAYAALAALPAGTVLVASNIGAPVLFYTRHRTFAGPYHRDVAGMLFALDAFMATPREAQALARARHVDYVAVCPGNADSGMLAHWAPDGLMAAIMADDPPSWLEPVAAEPGTPLRVYRLMPAG